MRLAKVSGRRYWVIAAMSCILPLSAQAQRQTKPSSGDTTYSTFDASIFGGGQWFQLYQGKKGTQKFEEGPIFGTRFTADFSKYVGGEASFTYGVNNLLLNPSQTTGYTGIGVRNYQFAINPVFHLTPRDSVVRPFLTVGPALVIFDPLENTVTTPQFPKGLELDSRYGPGLIYGGGVKINASRRVGIRLDVRGLYAKKEFFGLPDDSYGAGSVYIPKGKNYSALQATLGIVFRFRLKSETPPAPPAPLAPPAAVAPPPPPAPVAVTPPPPPDIRIDPIQGAHDVCPGDDIRLQAAARGWPADQTAQYQWLVNGQPVPGARESSFALPTQAPSGNQSITVQVTAAGASKTSDPVNVRIKEYRPPTIQFAVSPSTINYGDKVTLNATASSSECGGASTITYTASQGSVVGNIFDSTGLNFDPSRPGLQTATVRLTATARDQKNGVSAATADVTVNRKPEAKRLQDIVYPAGSARVNNCAKRVLLEELTPMLREDPNGRVVLIGHRDTNERGANLDRSRVFNAAAVLSAGTGICPQLELSRVQGNFVGTDQSAPTNPSFCGTSTTLKERNGQAVATSDDRAQFRRVEIWFVPGGADMPPGAAGAKDLPQPAVKALSCPR